MKMNMFSRMERSQTESAPDKQSKPADAILKTYWVSLLSLMLCVTMFFGTTVAWFSDDVSAPYNRIDVGSLSVMLDFMKPADMDYTTLAKTGDTNISNTKIFDENVPWAPGYTAVREIKVTNKGSLNLRYMFTFQKGNDNDTEYQWKEDLAKCFEVYVKDGSFGNEALPTNYNDLVNETDQDGKHFWTPVKNLDGHVANLQEIVSQKLTVHAADIKHDSEPAEHSFLVALHMKEDADIGVSGMNLPLGAYLIAYQESTETDDLGNTNQVLFVQNANELKAAAKGTSNYTIVLSEDITMEGDLTIDKPMQLDLNGKTLTLKDAGNAAFHGSVIVSGQNAKLVIRDRTVVGTNSTGGEIIPAGHIDVINGGTLIVNGGKLHKVRVDGSTMIMNGGIVEYNSEEIGNGITMYGLGKLTLNYGTIKVKEGDYSVFAETGNCTVTVEDTFRFAVGISSQATFDRKSGATLKVNGVEINISHTSGR